jgi:phosphohistidine phosphatase SixA
MQMEPKQRNLNDRGKGLTKSFGDAMRRLGLPGGEYTSKFNRAYETVVMVGFDGIGRTVDLTEGGLVDGTIQGWIVGISGGLKRSPWRKRRYKQGDRKCPARPPRR